MSNMGTTRKAPKTTSLNIRINQKQKEFISQAAALRKLSLSEFVIENAYDAASQVMADKARFVLSPEKWDEFCGVLDAPPKNLPCLKELFSRQSPFHEE